MRQQTTVTKDGKLHYTMSPVFETVAAKPVSKTRIDLIPGGGD